MSDTPTEPDLSPDLVLHAYASGIFPMAEHRDDANVFWVDPRRRGIIPLDGFHLSRSLARRMRRMPHQMRINTAFAQVMKACGDRSETWINPLITNIFNALHDEGHAHSLEVWAEGELIGGIYGLALGGVFCGESMFSRRTDASKMALAYLVDRLNMAGFTLLDTQFLTPHLASLGGIEITRAAYHRRLRAALEITADFTAPPLASAQEVLQRSTQTS
ncbi:leucyl/phenylalanyl-tRNA--protein transferase [Primorskyibacter aestuariivivens]|uniref:leucyl/phenylalanyl-tRNA--protein transferase n=1 Tax=Primorskyibacter aestuariivivens TaxID=1888912 RepID=UPI002300F7D8|nr:leucyl/phenylalanyl-tRNA--protein transferase [Primorskyibacter aestuariivivens]MDA7427203.1 leucyl/phenylalanyl-tRNA--protein transferase [Primorskyibacter aestuariivivens]